MNLHYDVIWIGTGQATMTIVPRLVQAGKRVAVVEAGHFGGTCVNNGCTPTKTLVASAYAIHTARRGSEFGFSTGPVTVDFEKVMAPQKQNRRDTSASIASSLATLTDGAVYKGFARFIDAQHVHVGDAVLSAETFVIHAGTRPVIPDISGIDHVPWLTNETILDLDTLPRHLAIVGGSYIALEFAQIFNRLGSQVTVLNRGNRLVEREDDDISELVAARLKEEGIDIRFECEVDTVSPEAGDILLTIKQGNSRETLLASHLLLATGRRPNSDTLDLDKAAVGLDKRGYIAVNDITQTSQSHIFAVGDINGRGAFTHTSVNDGEIFWDFYSRQFGLNTEAAEQPHRTLANRLTTYAMFIDPPLARAGMGVAEAMASGREVLMATLPMARIARAREKRETHGLVKILVDGNTEEILGVTVFGTGGDEVIGSFIPLMRAGISFKQYRRSVFPHPTITELMPWVLDDLKPLSS